MKVKSKRIKALIISSITVLVIAGVIFLSVYILIARPFQTTDNNMAPTLNKGDYALYLIRDKATEYFFNVKRGDIVIYSNPQKPGNVYVSRVIAIPGDKISFRNRFIFLNGKLLNEPYTSQPGSTYIFPKAILGQNCQELTLPKNKYFLLSDNSSYRLGGTLDSFNFGLIDINDILGTKLITYNPLRLTQHYRDTSHDKDLMDISNLDVPTYVKLINEKRTSVGVPPLISNDTLNKVAEALLKDMVDKKYYFYEEDKSLPVWQNAIAKYNIQASSSKNFTDTVFLNAGDLFNWYLSSQTYKEVLLSKDYSSISVATSIVTVNSCPQQLNITLLLKK